jgi:hypothetical protein
MGDQSALTSLGYNLAAFLANRQLGLQTAQQLPAYVRNDPRMQTVTALTEQSQRQVQANLPALMQTVQLTGAAPTAVPMLVHTT